MAAPLTRSDDSPEMRKHRGQLFLDIANLNGAAEALGKQGTVTVNQMVEFLTLAAGYASRIRDNSIGMYRILLEDDQERNRG